MAKIGHQERAYHTAPKEEVVEQPPRPAEPYPTPPPAPGKKSGYTFGSKEPYKPKVKQR